MIFQNTKNQNVEILGIVLEKPKVLGFVSKGLIIKIENLPDRL